MRIALFGGSFDPPHRGHLAVAEAATAAFALDLVLFAPAALQPLKPAGARASYTDRLEMITLLCAGHPHFQPSAVDAPRPDGSPNFTADTLEKLRDTLPPDTRSSAIVGADSFLDLRRWHRSADLLRLAEWIVVSRPGFSLSELDALGLTAEERSRVHLLENVADTTSATMLRERLSRGENCADLLGAPLDHYIRSRGLYLGANTGED